jgi:hypothetical protein
MNDEQTIGTLVSHPRTGHLTCDSVTGHLYYKPLYVDITGVTQMDESPPFGNETFEFDGRESPVTWTFTPTPGNNPILVNDGPTCFSSVVSRPTSWGPGYAFMHRMYVIKQVDTTWRLYIHIRWVWPGITLRGIPQSESIWTSNRLLGSYTFVSSWYEGDSGFFPNRPEFPTGVLLR